MLILKDIKKDYKIGENVTHALRGISLEFRRNEFVAILGPSGCGKTTLLNIIGGLDDYTSGNLIINHRSTRNFTSYDWDSYRNNSIGFVFQSYNLIMHQSVFSNVELALTLTGMKRSERREKVMNALAKVDLASETKKRPYQLSGGQMQRVAIARALVNSPDIVLADEPTGALDGENSIQIMELLSEVAKDRLVIMVTHNPELAEKYATRIIKVADGKVVDDSAPYSENWEIPEGEEKVNKGKKILNSFRNWWNPGLADMTATPEELEEAKRKEEEAKAKAKAEKKIAQKTKTSMSFFSALRLSLSNIITKKVRTALTAVAGSIGIIGIALVLSLSSGVSDFLTQTEEDSLSQYPIQIETNAIDVSTIVQTLASGSDNEEKEAYPDSDEITVRNVLDNLIVKIKDNGEDILGSNDMETVKKFCDEYITEDLGNVKYDYGTTLNIYSNNGYKYDKKTKKLVAPDESSSYFIINPFDVAISGALGGAFDLSQMGDISAYATGFQVWDELIDNQNLLNQQYDILGGKWPTEADELVLVVDEYNQIPDYIMFTLGLRDPSDALAIMGGQNSWEGMDLSVNGLLGLTYKVVSDADYYTQTGTSDSGVPIFTKSEKTDENKTLKAGTGIVAQKGMDLKIVGVVRLKEGVESGSISGSIAYSNKLNEVMLSKINDSEVVKAQKANPTVSVIDGSVIAEDGLEAYMEEKFGCANMNKPSKVSIIPNSFDSKEAIKTLIDTKYDEFARNLKQEEDADTKTYKIKYTDSLDLIMSFVKKLTTTITGVLVGFSAISLIVSSIMIGIITYTSVLERTKEIGVLRSLGARKKDITRVFLAETTMIGAMSGLIGIAFTYVMTFPINAILESNFGISGLAHLTWIPCVLLFVISIVLSDIAGLIPSKIASNKDPVAALRTE